MKIPNFIDDSVPIGKDDTENVEIQKYGDPVVPDYEMGAPFDINDQNITTKRERHVVIEEIRMRKDQPWTKVYNNLNRNMYSSHPYRRFLHSLGTK